MANILMEEFVDDSSDMDYEDDSSDNLDDSEAPSMMFEELVYINNRMIAVGYQFVFEDGEAPEWFEDLPGERLHKIQGMVNKNLHHGGLPIQFRNTLTNR